jgi:thiol:disulfide interchange protein
MTCKTNEAVALNTHRTKEVVLDNNIVTLKADKTHRRKADQVNELLVQLGNYAKTIPFIAIYAPGAPEPILLDGLVSQEQVINALEQAVQIGGAE